MFDNPFVGTVFLGSLLFTCCWIGYNIEKSIYLSRKREFERQHPGESFAQQLDGTNGIGFGSLAAIFLITVCVVLESGN